MGIKARRSTPVVVGALLAVAAVAALLVAAENSVGRTTAIDAASRESLAYLVEEEKLAGDVYTVLSQKWGTAVFSNIATSEDRHEARVAGLLQAYSIADPRKASAGEFTDARLQALYDELVAKGLQSPQDAYAVGVAIETQDLADLQKTLDEVPANASDIRAALAALQNGSRHHLAAFERFSTSEAAI